MKRLLRFMVTIAVLAVGGPRVASCAPANASAEWALIEQEIAAMAKKTSSGDSYADFVKDAESRDQLHNRLLAFISSFPSDKRVPEARFHLLMRPPVFLVESNPILFQKAGSTSAHYDEEALSRWKRDAAVLQAQLIADPETPSEWQRDILRRDLYLQCRDALARIEHGERVDLPALRLELDAWLARFPMSDRAAVPVESYMRVVAAGNPDAVESEWEVFSQSDNPVVQELAQGQLLIQRSKRKPLDWKFTALDGRQVNLEKLRGMIVLIDFWATWCVPCVKELPELAALYSRYHLKGFEIVGISLDAAADRGKLERFVASRNIPWPQHFDGQGRRNAYAVQYGIKSIPAKVLLDREGRVLNPRIQIEELTSILAGYLGN